MGVQTYLDLDDGSILVYEDGVTRLLLDDVPASGKVCVSATSKAPGMSATSTQPGMSATGRQPGMGATSKAPGVSASSKQPGISATASDCED